jgi:hypothetical protein
LEAALDEIAGSFSCAVELRQMPPDEQAVVIEVGAEARDEVADCDREDGWHWAEDAAQGTVELCGQACADFQRTGEIEVKFLCQ